MKKRAFTRLLALACCLCLAPLSALCEQAADDAAVTRSDFSLALSLHADAFPSDGQTDFRGWEAFLQKLALRGRVDTQRFLTPLSRVYFTGGLNLNGRTVVPFSYEGYWNYRYIRSAALNGQSVHFQMNNFFEFMLKPYYFMALPTQYLALLMYPEATAYLLEAYGQPISEVCGGTGSRTIPYSALYELCETLDVIASDDPDAERVYFYLTALLVDLQASDAAFDAVCYWEDYLDALDPQQEGLTVTVSGATESYVIGQTTVLTKTERDGAMDFTLFLPTADGFALTLSYHYAPEAVGAAMSALLSVTSGADTSVRLALDATGLPKAGETEANGALRFTVGGSRFENAAPVSLAFRLSRTAEQLPYALTLGVDWLHPQTEKPAVTLLYKADMQAVPETVLEDRVYDNLHDFFHLNESFLEQYQQAFALPLALAVAPIVLEMPAGVINDVVRFLNSTGILASLGIE